MAVLPRRGVFYGSVAVPPVTDERDQGVPMRRRRFPPSAPGRRPSPPRDPRPRDFPSQIVVVTSGLALYLAILWLGVEVIGDTWTRSAVMAALIVAIAGVGYAFTRQAAGPGGR